MINQFFDLVQINSETKEERIIADYLINLFSSLNIKVMEDESAKKTGHQAGNLIAHLEGTNKQVPAIYFTAHMDTVAPGKQVKPIIKDEVIYSDGTTVLGADDKAGIASIIEMIYMIKEHPIHHGDIYFLITSGEESGLVGSKYLDTDKLPADFGYALDSDGQIGTIITAAPGQIKLYATIKGKAAHAGVRPEQGISAISIASKAITKMPLGRIDEETTANIGSFEGTGPTNVVCDEVLLIAEARSLSENKLNKQVEQMKTALQEATEQFGGEVEIKLVPMYPSYYYSKEDQVVRVAMSAVKEMGKKPILTTSGGGSDANHLSGKNIPTVNLAVGYENIHTKNESISISNLLEVPELMYEIIKQISK